MPGIYVTSCDDLPYGPGQTDYEYDRLRQEQDDDAAEALRAQAERDIRDPDWWKDKLGGVSIADDAANVLARCMTNLDDACRGCPISREAITTALSNLQSLARADARDEAQEEA